MTTAPPACRRPGRGNNSAEPAYRADMAKIYRKSELADLQPEPCPKCGTPCTRRLHDVTGPFDTEQSYSVSWSCPVKGCTMRPE